MSDLKTYVAEREDELLEELVELLEIPSVSTDDARKDDVARCAERVRMGRGAGDEDGDVEVVEVEVLRIRGGNLSLLPARS